MTIKRKLKTCKDCEQEKYLFSGGCCKYCAMKRNTKVNQNKRSKKPNEPKKTKKRLKTLPKLRNDARVYFQRWMRYIKTGKDTLKVECCYGCGTRVGFKGSNGAHFLKAECYSTAVFDEDNVWVSCVKCNILDPSQEYRNWLEEIRGVEFVEDLIEKHKRTKSYKWDRDFLNEVLAHYKELCKEIE